MSEVAMHRRREQGQTWLGTLLGIGILITGGFVLGLIVGIVAEEPELVVGHVAGRSNNVRWDGSEPAPGGSETEAVGAEALLPAVSAPPPLGAASSSAAGSAGPAATGAAGPRPAPAPPPPASPRAARSAARATGPRYAVQVGAFREAAAAERVADTLRRKGFPVGVVAPTDDDRWRVRVGPVDAREEADRLAGRLKDEERLPTWVLAIRRE